MRAQTLALLRCPSGCAVPLDLSPAGGGEKILAGTEDIEDGLLRCPICRAGYRVEQGIAAMLPPALESGCAEASPEVQHKRSEMAARDAQVESYDRMLGLALFGKLELPLTLGALRPQRVDRILEAGCGTGRMTRQFAARCRDLIAIDFSWESLRLCQRKLHAAGIVNVDLIQADVCHLPFADAVFDRVVSCQVLEHVPTPESRACMVRELSRTARKEGTVVVSAYRDSLAMRTLAGKEGRHAGGIYFYRFRRAELRDLLGQSLRVERMTGALVYHFLARCRK
jgi:ubiquinone/menaquinone biosynthesis C-methylase UbiE/uncharacterized protein YbaR (Trm112 family)